MSKAIKAVCGSLVLCILSFSVGNISAEQFSIKEMWQGHIDTNDVKEADTDILQVNSEGDAMDASSDMDPSGTDAYRDLEMLQEYSFAYQQLDGAEQRVYLQILDAIYAYQGNTVIPDTNKDMLGKVFQCILNDHPEIFYVEGYTFTENKVANNVTDITFSAIYSMTKDEAKNVLQEIEDKADACVSGIPDGAGDYEKVKYVYEYLIRNTEYNLAAKDNQNICSVFLYGESVCQGYAKATQYLLQKCGVVSTLVLGEIMGGSSHAWNLVKVDGEYYYVDTTWGDASYQIDNRDNIEDIPVVDINYDYLCVTTEQLSRTHSINNVVGLPQCTCLDANYYVREGVYFVDYNSDQIQQAFDKAIAEGKSSLTVKASDFGTYTQLKNALIVRKQVFDFIDEEIAQTITYLDNESEYSITFWF